VGGQPPLSYDIGEGLSLVKDEYLVYVDLTKIVEGFNIIRFDVEATMWNLDNDGLLIN
jgi:hypothetical protein